MSLSTHVLDTAQGKAAAGVHVMLERVEGESRYLVADIVTNADGRTEGPLIDDPELGGGTYELIFAVGDYFAAQGVPADEPPFLDLVTIRFTMKAGERHYHVPLLVSPWSYSTYRGS